MQSICAHSFSVPFRLQTYFTRRVFRSDNPLLASLLHDTPKVLVCVDDGVERTHPELGRAIRTALGPLLAGILPIPGGEQCKEGPATLEQVHRAIHACGLCRHSLVLAIGGGAVLDLVGYAAATAHRGIRLLRMPTTVLAQGDAGIGVKNGINAFGKKNFLGTFAPPFAVVNDSTFLLTLEPRDWRAGIAEAVKVACLKDASFFQEIERSATALSTRSLPAMERLIFRCAELHMMHIAGGGDPFESGAARPLDFGHWLAHKLESLTRYALRHGEAVAIGIAVDSLYAMRCDLLSAQACARILALLRALGFSLFVPELASRLDEPNHPDSIFYGLDEFREHIGGRLCLTFPCDIGRALEVREVDLAQYRAVISTLAAGEG